MSRDRRKGLIAGYKKAGPTLQFTIKASIAAIILAFVFFSVQMWLGASKELQKKAEEDRDVKHREIVDSQTRQINILSQFKIGIEELRRISDVVHSSSIIVYLKFYVSERTPRDFNGTIATGRDTCTLETKSGGKLNYTSATGSTRMIRKRNTYEFLLKAHYASESESTRNAPEEFVNAKAIVIPMTRFLQIMKKKMSPKGVCTLTRADIGFSVNGTEVTRHAEDFEVEVTEGKTDVIYFNFK